MKYFSKFHDAYRDIDQRFRMARPVKNTSWQSQSGKPEFATYELMDQHWCVPMTENLDDLRKDIQPNLPWADIHFETERVSGQPINPGESYKQWPFGNSATNFLNSRGQFDHSYAERYWPKYAGRTADGTIPQNHWEYRLGNPNEGIRNVLGDLNDIVDLMARDPTTRQAVLPVWFPEDTGNVPNVRVPCSISYTFMYREGFLHVFYHMRSCDFIRHYRDDVYLTVRLLIHVLQHLRPRAGSLVNWHRVQPGRMTMFINSLHMFVNDWQQRYHAQT